MSKIIKIVKSTYGLRVGYSIIPKKPGDAPFEVEDAIADRLVLQNIAEIVLPFDEPEEDDGIEELTKPQIIAKLEELGITFKARANKDELLALLDEALEGSEDDDEPEEDDGDDSEGPDLTTSEIVE